MWRVSTEDARLPTTPRAAPRVPFSTAAAVRPNAYSHRMAPPDAGAGDEHRQDVEQLASFLWAADRHDQAAERYDRQGLTEAAARERGLADLNRARAQALSDPPPAEKPS